MLVEAVEAASSRDGAGAEGSVRGSDRPLVSVPVGEFGLHRWPAFQRCGSPRPTAPTRPGALARTWHKRCLGGHRAEAVADPRPWV